MRRIVLRFRWNLVELVSHISFSAPARSLTPADTSTPLLLGFPVIIGPDLNPVPAGWPTAQIQKGRENEFSARHMRAGG